MVKAERARKELGDDGRRFVRRELGIWTALGSRGEETAGRKKEEKEEKKKSTMDRGHHQNQMASV